MLAAVGDAGLGESPRRWRAWCGSSEAGDLGGARVSVWLSARNGRRDWEEGLKLLRTCAKGTAWDATEMLARLAGQDSPWATPVGLYCLAHRDEAVFRAAARLLAKGRARGALAALVRFRVVAGAEGRGRECMEHVRRQAVAEAPGRRADAVGELAVFYTPESETILVRAARDSDGAVRARAAAGLGLIGRSADSLAALERLCEDRDAKVAAAARRWLDHRTATEAER